MKTNHQSLNTSDPSARKFSSGWCVLALLPMLVWAGCKLDSNTAADSNPAGIYTLVSVDGKAVPAQVTHEGAGMTVKSGVFTIGADGTCVSKSVFVVGSNPDVNREVQATYTREGAKLTMKWQGAGVTTGTVEGNKFTMNNEGMIFVYQR